MDACIEELSDIARCLVGCVSVFPAHTWCMSGRVPWQLPLTAHLLSVPLCTSFHLTLTALLGGSYHDHWFTHERNSSFLRSPSQDRCPLSLPNACLHVRPSLQRPSRLVKRNDGPSVPVRGREKKVATEGRFWELLDPPWRLWHIRIVVPFWATEPALLQTSPCIAWWFSSFQPPTPNSVGGFPFLHTLSSTYCL